MIKMSTTFLFLRVSLKILATGVVTSPNFPGNYPDNLAKIQTIQVESGKMLKLEFTLFDVFACNDLHSCPCDFVKIIDGDGTTLMDCGFSSGDPSSSDYFLPPIITTTSNTVDIIFSTDSSDAATGWSISWTAVIPGG